MYSEDDLGADSDYSVRSDAIDLLSSSGEVDSMSEVTIVFVVMPSSYSVMKAVEKIPTAITAYEAMLLRRWASTMKVTLSWTATIAYSVIFSNPNPIATVPTLLARATPPLPT